MKKFWLMSIIVAVVAATLLIMMSVPFLLQKQASSGYFSLADGDVFTLEANGVVGLSMLSETGESSCLYRKEVKEPVLCTKVLMGDYFVGEGVQIGSGEYYLDGKLTQIRLKGDFESVDLGNRLYLRVAIPVILLIAVYAIIAWLFIKH